LPLFAMRPADPKGFQFVVKYTIDRIVAGFLLLLISPVMAALALATKLSMGGQVFFRQRRVGLDGRPFEILKFRSMKDPAPIPMAVTANGNGHVNGNGNGHVNGNGNGHVNGNGNGHAPTFSPSADTAPGGVEGEDRRTAVGRFLRKTSL